MTHVKIKLNRLDAFVGDEVWDDGEPVVRKDRQRLHVGNGVETSGDQTASENYLPPMFEVRSALEAGDAATLSTAAADAQNKADTAQAAAMAEAAIDATDKSDAAQAAAQAYADSLVVAIFRPVGGWDASIGTWPTTGSGSGGGVRRGDSYNVTVAGTIGSKVFDIGDVFYANQATPGQVDGNWQRFEANTEQANETVRGTMRVATQAVVENEATTNDTDAVTPKKLWQAFAHAWTLSAFLTAVRGTLLTGLSTASSVAIDATDSILVAAGKLQAQVNTLFARVITAEVSSDFATSGTSFIDITGAAITLAANSTYQLTIDYTYQVSNANSGCKVSVTMTGSPTSRTLKREHTTNASGATTDGRVGSDDGGADITTSAAADQNYTGVLYGTVRTSGSACVVQPRLARGGASATNVTIKVLSITAIKCG